MVQVGFIVLVLIKSATCAFFDLTDVDDPLSLFWTHSKDFSLAQPNSPCIATVQTGGPVVRGRCKHKSLCLLSGGQIHNVDNCGNFLTCCTQPTLCSQKTKSKVSYFNSDAIDYISGCEYTVEAMNDNICQIRIDFEQFNLSPSKRIPEDTPPGAGSSYTQVCNDDYLTVTPPVYNVPPRFCGNNDGQHVYVHLYSERQVKLQLHLAQRTSTAASPTWKIKVTQLECSTKQNLFTRHNNIYGHDRDLDLIAPEGATQYFFQPSGQIRSFGYNNGQGEYISGLHYTIAFRTNPHMNCIRFSRNYIHLRHRDAPLDIDDRGYCEDYLFIPDFVDQIGSSAKFGSQLCSEQTTPSTILFYSTGPAPFDIYFHSNPTFLGSDADGVHAFDIHYEFSTCNIS